MANLTLIGFITQLRVSAWKYLHFTSLECDLFLKVLLDTTFG